MPVQSNESPRIHAVNTEKAYPGATYGKARVLVDGYSPAGFGVGEVKPGESSRKETGGPEVPGPWAYAYGKAGVLDNRGGTGAEIDRQRADGSLVDGVRIGDLLNLNGRLYRVEPDHNRNIKLVGPVEAPAPAAVESPVDRFIRVYREKLIDAVQAHPDEYAYSPAAVPAVIAKLEPVIRANIRSVGKDGRAIKAVCKELGIKHTYAAMAAYLGQA